MTAARFFGVLLIAAGALMAALCGLCSIAVMAVSLSARGGGGGGEFSGLSMLPVVLLIGGVPTVFGALMIWGGIVLVRVKPAQGAKIDPKTFD